MASLCGFLVAAYYIWFLVRYAINIPLADDILDVLRVLVELEKNAGIGDKAALLFEQHNDHRTLATRLGYWALYGLQGEIDFRMLTFIANTGLLILLCLLFAWMPRGSERSLVLLAAALVLFQIRAYGITLWSMAAFAYFYVYVYGFASLLCLRNLTPSGFVCAIVFAALATFTLASGQVIWLVGLVSLIHQALHSGHGKWKYVPAWILAAFVFLWLWRWGLETPNTPLALVGYLASSPVYYLHYFLALLGSVASESSIFLATLTGAAMLALLTLCSWRQRHADLSLELACWFVVLSTAAVVLGRAALTDLEYALSARYSFPSVIMLACSAVLVCVRFPGSRLPTALPVVIVCAAFWAYSWSVYPAALQPYLDKRVQKFNSGVYSVWGSPRKETNAIVAEAIERGIYKPPEKPFSRLVIKG
jgi:hypothetical protein